MKASQPDSLEDVEHEGHTEKPVWAHLTSALMRDLPFMPTQRHRARLHTVQLQQPAELLSTVSKPVRLRARALSARDLQHSLKPKVQHCNCT